MIFHDVPYAKLLVIHTLHCLCKRRHFLPLNNNIVLPKVSFCYAYCPSLILAIKFKRLFPFLFHTLLLVIINVLKIF